VAQVTGRSPGGRLLVISPTRTMSSPAGRGPRHAAGNTADLPVLTPEPAPIQEVDFTLYLHSFSDCGSSPLTVVNTGPELFRNRPHLR
jgi:hypothetical protein